MLIVTGKVEYGATHHNVGEGVLKGHGFDRFQTKVLCREIWCDGCGEVTCCIKRPWIRIHAKHFKTLPQQVNQVAAGPASGIEDPHPGRDAAAQELIEPVDIDLAELVLKIGHVASIILDDPDSPNQEIE